MENNLSRYTCASLVPLGMKWTCVCSGNGYVIHSHHRVSLEPCLLFFVGLLLVVAFGFPEGQLSMSWERISSVSCRLRRGRGLESCVCVACPTAVGLAVVVVPIGVVGLVGCLSLLLTKLLSTESHVKPSCAVVS